MSRPAPPTRVELMVAAIARALMAWRKPLLALGALITIALGVSASRVQLDPGFYKLIPQKHPLMQAFRAHAATFAVANRVLVSVQWKGEGDIYNAEFMQAIRGVTDAVFFTRGVNRAQVFSIFTPNVRYIEVTEEGFAGEAVIPARFSADAKGLAQVRVNVARSGEIGHLVANDERSALVRAELLETDPTSGARLDYLALARQLETIRVKFTNERIDVHIIGFAKVVGDVVDGLLGVLAFFGAAFAITAALLWRYTRSVKLSALALLVALLPVVWLLGLLPLMGYGIDPMSILVPFLIFAIGVSHAVQMSNAWKLEVLAGASPAQASQTAFRKLAIPGSVALLTNALGFLVIMRIDIGIVRELGISACLGVLLMIVTNKVILPIGLSYLELEASARQARATGTRHPLWWAVAACAEPGPALACLGVSLLLLAAGSVASRHLITGDVGVGVPELRADSRYNRDNGAIAASYSIGMDVLSVFAQTQGLTDACLDWPVMNAVERFDLHMRGVDGVRSVATVAGLAKRAAAGNNEGNPRWAALQRNVAALRTGVKAASPELGLNTEGCGVIHVMVFLKDHQGATLAHVLGEARKFIDVEKTPNVTFRLAGGNAGVAAASNQAVEHAEVEMLAAIFGAIVVLCWLSLRDWRAVLCIMVPLTLVSILCNALMALLGVGLKVATLPVIAMGVGVGVDYGIYLYERIQHEIEVRGSTLREAFHQALRQRGTAAVFTAITMSIGVGSWGFSALAFQADMGILLAFMFLVNALGAVLLLPAMACWLNVGAPKRPSPIGARPGAPSECS